MRLTLLLFENVGELTKKYANLPERYIKRSMEQVYWKTPNAIQYLPRTVQRKKFRFTTNRPWTYQFLQQNERGTHRKKVFVEPILEWSIFRGDRVQVLVGRDKGKQGIVSRVIQERNWVLVQGLNCHMRFTGKDKDFPGVAVLSEAPLLVTNQVSLVDPSDLLPTKIEWRFTEEGERVRVSERTGRIIPMPLMADETHDYKSKSAYKESPKDTVESELTKITFSPTLRTFEMDVMNEMEKKEENVINVADVPS
ncbi:Probable 39S ribosomal protein L24, mitochondrial [Gryllus bimaculatus]|nr:Probable 39S ribosomal protein L24, mitochondrial [Gryllus bimaculatus]